MVKKCLSLVLVLFVLVTQTCFIAPIAFAADTPNLAQGKTITASSHTQVYYATNANDGNVNTYWEGAPGSYPNTLTVDLGSAQSVYKVVLKLNPSWGTRTQTLSVLGSTNNQNYTTLKASAQYTFTQGSNTVTITFTETTVRYVRLNFTANTGATGGQAAEFEVYGTSSGGQYDLVVTDISWSPANPVAGDAVTFSATIKNQGNAPTPGGVIHGVAFQIDGGGTTIWSDNYTSSIPAGGSVTVTANGGTSGSTWTATPGTHNILAWVDDVNRMPNEANENNNQYTESLTVGGGSGGTPDLVVTDITCNPASPITGDSTVFSAVVKNQGTGATPAGAIIGVSFWVDGTQVSWSDTSTTSLAPGASRTLTANSGPGGSAAWTATTGTHTIMAWVDDVSRITESNENNNQYSESLTVATAPMPDLIVTDITYTPANPVTGDSVSSFKAVVKNQGNASGAPGTIVIKVDGTQVAQSTNITTPLAAGATLTVSATGSWTASLGEHTFSATVDNANITNESNETNNTYNKNVTVSPKPGVDLVVTSISWSPSTPQAGNNVSFSAVVKNQGTVAGAAGIVAFKVDGVQVAASSNQTTPIAAGGTQTITANGTWQATSGTHTVTATADNNNTTSETDESNNSLSMNLTVISGNRGATMPYVRYESEDAVYGGGAVLRSAPDFNYALAASEASNQKYVALPNNGSYVEWTIGSGGAGVTMRFTMPDSSDGMGLNGSLDCYVNGSKVSTIQLSSYWSWQYFIVDQPGDAPNGGQPAFRFDEVHWKLPTALKSGDKLRIQKTNGDSLEYGVDFVEVEPVPSPIPQPANSLSVTSFGATPNDGTDDLAAFTACVNAAVSQGKIVYIPEGTFHLGNMWVIGSIQNPISNITILGAGIWHTNIQFTSPNAASGGISLRLAPTGRIDFSNVYLNSRLRSRYGQNAIYKCFMDNFGTNSYIHDFWLDHFECGFWVGDYAHTPAIPATGLLIENGRIRNNLADGVNFCQGTSNSTVRNCSVRNNGDDGLAIWPDYTNGAPMGVNNTFAYNTIENNWRAGAIGIFGGSGHSAHHNYIKDCFMGSGIRLNTVFPGYHFENNTGMTFSDTTIINCGTSKDCYNGERGAIDLEASITGIKNITFENIDIINTQRDAIQIGYGGGFTNINFNNITIDGTGKDAITTSRFTMPHLGAALMVYTNNGSVTFRNLVTRNIELPELYLVQQGFNVNFQ